MDAFQKTIVERRMVNWGISIARFHGGGAIAPGFQLFRASQVRSGAIMPCLYGEAEETEIALSRLVLPQRRILTVQYVWAPPVVERFKALSLPQRSYYRLLEVASNGFLSQLKALRPARSFATRWRD